MRLNNKKIIKRFLIVTLCSLALSILLLAGSIVLKLHKTYLAFVITIAVLTVCQIIFLWKLRYTEVTNSGQLFAIKEYHPLRKRQWQNDVEMPFANINSIEIIRNLMYDHQIVIRISRMGKGRREIHYTITGFSDEAIRTFAASCKESIHDCRISESAFEI